jgi:hypothetical protein
LAGDRRRAAAGGGGRRRWSVVGGTLVPESSSLENLARFPRRRPHGGRSRPGVALGRRFDRGRDPRPRRGATLRSMRNLLALSALVTLGALGACSSSKPSPQLSANDSRDVLIDRNWIDRMPESTTDRLHVYRFVPNMGGGVYQDRTLFKGTFELFLFKVEGNDIVFSLPETHQKVTSPFKIEKIAEGSFDLKLTITNDPRGPHEYYSIRAQTDRDGHVLEQALAAKRAAL